MPKTLHFFQSSCVLGTACLLGSPCILKPSCISREALGISSPLAAHIGWLLQVAGHGTLFSSWLLGSAATDSTLNQLHLLGHASTSRSFALACVGAISIVKSATNTAFSEVNVMEPFAFFRTVALAWTEGLNTWASHAWLDFHPMVVPVGRSALGRLINAAGSVLDPFLD